MSPKAAIGLTDTYKSEEVGLIEGLHMVVHGAVELPTSERDAEIIRLLQSHGGRVHHVQFVAHILQTDAHESAIGGLRVHHADGVVQRCVVRMSRKFRHR